MYSGMKKYYNVVEEEYSTKDGFNYKNNKAMFMTKGGDRCPSPPKHSSFIHKQSYEGYDGGHAKHGHEGFKSHHSESWIEKEKYDNGGWGGGHHGGYSEHNGGWGGRHSGYPEHGGHYSSGSSAFHNGGGSGGSYGHHYESHKSMGGGSQKGAPLWSFKGIRD